jgi:hypothetical protein
MVPFSARVTVDPLIFCDDDPVVEFPGVNVGIGARGDDCTGAGVGAGEGEGVEIGGRRVLHISHVFRLGFV